jgi:hypothetical protein
MGRSDQAVARTDSVRLKLSPDMVARLERLAEAYGMPLSTLGAFALAEWVVGKESSVRLAREAVMGIGAALGGDAQKALAEFATSPQLEAITAQASSVLAGQIGSGNGAPST